MRCSFRPRDCDPTTEDMGVVWKGYWDALEGCWANILNRGKCVTSLRRDTTALPVSPVHTPWEPTVGGKRPSPLPKRDKRDAPVHVGVSDCKTDNGENARMHEANTYANDMHMMA